jgi:hypothetical protein
MQTSAESFSHWQPDWPRNGCQQGLRAFWSPRKRGGSSPLESLHNSNLSELLANGLSPLAR